MTLYKVIHTCIMKSSMNHTHPKSNILGGISPATFLREYWQKKPLLIRQAISGFNGLLSASQFRTLASSEEVQSRLIVREGKKWELHHGPFSKSTWRSLHANAPWTILVQELNFHLFAAEQLLEHFNFIPHARLDDVMVSHACAGGGVGPHVDSYDVFLLQGPGRRRWRISKQKNLTLQTGLPLKILKSFKHEEEWVLEPGDMLYLPPNYAHEGVAIDECFTYSIGFRAPSAREWVAEFLSDFAERLEWPGQYSDASLKSTLHPGELPKAMNQFLANELKRLDFNADSLADFNGRFLTDPKPHVFFNPPELPLNMAHFQRDAKEHGIRLDPRTRFMYAKEGAWCNGAPLNLPPELRPLVTLLADQRRLSPKEVIDALRTDCTAALKKQLWLWWLEWYENGWLQIDA
jgi:50S ribosomal protein L16 3-hydroxylase